MPCLAKNIFVIGIETGKKAYCEIAVVAKFQAAETLEPTDRFHIKLDIKCRFHVLVLVGYYDRFEMSLGAEW
jgi:hypothetical protein